MRVLLAGEGGESGTHLQGASHLAAVQVQRTSEVRCTLGTGALL